MSKKLESIQQESVNVLGELFQGYAGRNFAVRLWDHSCWHFSERGSPACTIVFKTPASLRSMIVNPNEITLGEAFIHHELDVEGDLFSVFDVVDYILNRPPKLQHSFLQSISRTSSRLRQWLRELGSHTRQRDRASIAYHYDQPVEFYRLWLSRTLVYSCGYFRTGDESLDQAQENKLELICRKLRLEPLERFLDIGCGWGSLILHAASQHGAYAHGITLSEQQAKTAVQRIDLANLTQSCAVDLQDYRTMSGALPFDKIASVGMFEHVGRGNFPQYFTMAYRLLKPGGVFLNHGIASSSLSPQRKPSFMDRYVFPDGELVTLHEALQAAEEAGFEVRDVENLREHYEQTLRFWVKELERNADLALQYVSEATYRIWRLYMAGSAAAFRRGDIAVYQTLLNRPIRGKSGLPLTREDWYCPASQVQEETHEQQHSIRGHFECAD
jgi:cyclopropane-fatty-acyl-phospholipid synthase